MQSLVSDTAHRFTADVHFRLSSQVGILTKALSRSADDLSLLVQHQEVLLHLENKAVVQMRVLETVDKRYRLYVDLVDTQELNVLSTAKGRPKEWSNLTTLARHVSGSYAGIPPLKLLLQCCQR